MKRYSRLSAVILGTALSALGCGPSVLADPAGPANPVGQEGHGLPPGAVRLKSAEIIDAQGFDKPMVAATVLIPHDWRAQGGVVWNPQDTCGNGYNFNWRADAPDGSMAAAIIPSFTWTSNNFGAPAPAGCVALQIANVQQYLEHIVRQSRPDARILDFRVREDLQQEFATLNSHTPMPMGELRTWVEAGEVLIGYSEQGREFRETAAAVVIFTFSRSQGLQPGHSMDTFTGSALPGYAFRAPNGALDFKMAEAIRTSIRVAPAWQQQISAHNAAIARTNIEGARKRSEIIAKSNEEIRAINQRGWEERNQSSDRQHRAFIEGIRGVETYDDPMSSVGQVELSNHYESAYRLNDGSYVLTNDPSFDPYAATGQDGVKLEPSK
jgi:hypothetical protein